MANRDLYSNVRVMNSLLPANRTGDANGTGVDTANFGSCVVAVHMGNSADTLNATNTIALELEESSDDSTYSDVAVADMFNEAGTTASQFNFINAAAEDSAVFVVGYNTDSNRYVRPVINFSGTHSSGTPCSALVLLGHPAVAPITVQQANRS